MATPAGIPVQGWLTIAAVCVGGAISPGPSLALVLRNTARGGRAGGVMTGIGHGIGVGLYALAAVAGAAAVFSRYPMAQQVVELLGAIFLAYLGVDSWRPARAQVASVQTVDSPGGQGFVQGFLFAFLNPKIAIFFLALLTPFLPLDAPIFDRAGVALLALLIDAGWYVLVAAILSSGDLLQRIEARSVLIDRVMGIILLSLSLWMVSRLL